MPSATEAARNAPELRLLRSFARRIDQTDAGAHNNLGVLYYSSGLYEEALGAFMRAVELDPRMDVARRNLEVASLSCGRADARVAELKERLRISPGDQAARWELARVCALLGDHPEAVAQFTELLKSQPDDAAAQIQLGLSHKAVDAIEAAYACFSRALEIDSDNSLVCLYLAEIDYRRGLNDRAIDLLRTAIKRNADNYEAWYLLGFVLGDAGRPDEARAAAARALELSPELARTQPNLALVELPTARYVDKARRDAASGPQVDTAADAALAHVTLGLACRNRGYHAEALTHYQRALERGEDLDLVQQAMAELHLLRGDGRQALELYDALLQRYPQHAKLWNARGVAIHQAGWYIDALRSYDQALAMDPAYGAALNNSGVARYHAGDHHGAEACFHRAIECDPASTKARLNQALLLYRAKRAQLAIEAYRAVLSAGEPANPVAWNGIGRVLADNGRFAEARTAYARAIQARPRYAEAHYNLSFALSSLGDFEGAMRENQLALEIDPYYVPQRFALAVDLEMGAPDVPIEPELERATDAPVENFAFDSAMLDSLFGQLAPAESTSTPARQDDDAYAMATDYLAQGSFDRAHAETLRAMRRGADAARGGTLLGDIFARQGLWGEALERYGDARSAVPDHAAAMLGEATALLRLGRAPESLTLAETLLARHPDDVDVLLIAAAARADAGDVHHALRTLHEARHAAPRADVHRYIGDLARRTGDLDSAIAAYRAALALDARCVDVRLALAEIHTEARRWADAEGELNAALELAPARADATLALCRLRRQCGQPRDALHLLIELLERDLYHFEALMTLGETLLELGQPSDGLVAFRRVLRLDPSHLGARRAIRTLLAAEPRLEATGTEDRWP